MNESLFTTRQLTEYREWPTGEYGCFFYVADAPTEKERFQGAVYLIDAAYRKGDKVGAYNTLHQSEINILPNLQPILKGFAAFLFAQDSNQWIEDRTILDKWWESYYQWCMDKRPQSGFETEYILCECRNWTIRRKDMIQCFLLNPNMEYLYKNAMLHVIRDVLFKNTKQVQDIISKWHPYLLLPQREQSDTKGGYMQYDYYSNAMTSTKGIIVSGIQAMLLQFSIIHYPVKEANNAQNLDKLIDFLLNKLGNSPDNAYLLEDVRMPNYDFKKTEKKLYEFSLKFNRERLEPIFKRDTSFYILSNKEQEWGFINYLCRLELKYFCQNDITVFLSNEEAQKMRNLLLGYFGYLSKKLEGSRYEKRMRAEIEKVFPEMIVKENTSSEDNDSKSANVNPFLYLILPEKGNYNALVNYVIERRKHDPKFAEELDMKSTIKARCKYLEPIIGWYPDPNSLGHNLIARAKKYRDTGKLNEFPTR